MTKLAREPKIVTSMNASIVDKAQAWNAVETAQQRVNERAAQSKLTAFDAYRDALHAYNTCTSPAGSVYSSLRWADVREAQKKLNKAARAYHLEGVDALDAAVAYYVDIGGDHTRAPGVGGLS